VAQKNLSAFPVLDFPQIPLREIETAIGRKLIQADVLRMQIEVLQYSNDHDRVHQFYAMLAFGLFLGACIGCAIISRF
jgi:hypothetical protein